MTKVLFRLRNTKIVLVSFILRSDDGGDEAVGFSLLAFYD